MMKRNGTGQGTMGRNNTHYRRGDEVDKYASSYGFNSDTVQLTEAFKLEDVNWKHTLPE